MTANAIERLLRLRKHHEIGCAQMAAPGLGLSPEFSGQECDCGLTDALARVDTLLQAAKDMESRVVSGPEFDLGEVFNAAGRLAAAVRAVETGQ